MDPVAGLQLHPHLADDDGVRAVLHGPAILPLERARVEVRVGFLGLGGRRLRSWSRGWFGSWVVVVVGWEEIRGCGGAGRQSMGHTHRQTSARTLVSARCGSGTPRAKSSVLQKPGCAACVPHGVWQGESRFFDDGLRIA